MQKYFAALFGLAVFVFQFMGLQTSSEQVHRVLQNHLPQDAQVLVIVESEHPLELTERRAKILSAINKFDSSFGCLFLPWDPRFDAAVVEYWNGQSYEESFLKRHLAHAAQEKKDFNPNSVGNPRLPILLDELKGKFSVRGVDFDYSSEAGKKYDIAYDGIYNNDYVEFQDREDFMDMNFFYRNILMAENIDNGIRKQKCRRSVVIIDEEQATKKLGEFFFNAKLTSVPDYLEKMGHRVAVFNLKKDKLSRKIAIIEPRQASN